MKCIDKAIYYIALNKLPTKINSCCYCISMKVHIKCKTFSWYEIIIIITYLTQIFKYFLHFTWTIFFYDIMQTAYFVTLLRIHLMLQHIRHLLYILSGIEQGISSKVTKDISRLNVTDVSDKLSKNSIHFYLLDVDCLIIACKTNLHYHVFTKYLCIYYMLICNT